MAGEEGLHTLEDLRFDNLVLRALPVEEGPNRPRPVAGACFSRVHPTPVDGPRVVVVSEGALRLLDLDPAEASSRPSEFAECFGGNRLLPGTQPAAHCYAGHQFGSFAGQLGDGAALYLGEVVNSRGERWELQLKGAGPTPYSRSADGRKVLRSSLREFLCSEHMAALGIPTTRAGSLVTSDTRIERDPLYDGHVQQERASVISRIAPSFIRFGSFEIFKPQDPLTGRSGPSAGREGDMLPGMVDYVIRTHFPEVWAAHGGPPGLEGGPDITPQQRADMTADWYSGVCRRTGRLVAQWQCVGWCHGVLNTDNMSILGLTIDYGPFGFMDRYDPGHVCNGSDDSGRYDYQGQPEICRWNCEMLAAALGGALLPPAKVRAGLAAFDREYDSTYRSTMRRKLGLLVADEGAADDTLTSDLLQLMADTGADWTNTWRALATFPMPPPTPSEPGETARGPEGGEPAAGAAQGEGAGLPFPDGGFLGRQLSELASVDEMAKGSGSKIPEDNLNMMSYVALRDPAILHAMGLTPEFIKAQMARAQAAAKWRATTPEAKSRQDAAAWGAWLSRYGARLQREAALGGSDAERVRAMNAANPRVVLRNWVAEEAIRAAEKGDYAPVRQLLAVLTQPFKEADDVAAGEVAGAHGKEGDAQPEPAGAPEPVAGVCPYRIGGKPPAWAGELCVTCSS